MWEGMYFFFLSNFLQKKVKLSENLEKQFQNWRQTKNNFEKLYCGFLFSTILDFFGTHKKVVTLEHEF